MDAVPLTPLQRTRIIFFLILFAAALWAVFLIRAGEFFQFSLMLALIAGLNPVLVFLDVKSSQKIRGWIFFYLMILVALLWATFLMMQGTMLWISLLLFIVVSGMCLFSLVVEGIEPGVPNVSSCFFVCWECRMENKERIIKDLPVIRNSIGYERC